MKLLLPVDNVVADAFSNDANTQVVPPDRFRMAGKVWISDRKLQNCSLMLLKLLKPLYGTDRWDASRCRNSRQEPKQLQQHWLKQMQLRSSAAEIPQQLNQLGYGDKMTHISTGGGASLSSWKEKNCRALQQQTTNKDK